VVPYQELPSPDLPSHPGPDWPETPGPFEEGAEAYACRWVVEQHHGLDPALYPTEQTFFISSTAKKGGDGHSETSPIRLEDVYIELLARILSDKIIRKGGYRFLFKRGDVWTRDDTDFDLSAEPGHVNYGRDAVLLVLVSGTEEAPILIEAYGDHPDPPRFEGTAGSATPYTGNGIILLGAEWVQIADLEITGFEIGVKILTYSGVNIAVPLRGPNHLNLSNLSIHENHLNGVMVTSGVLSSDNIIEGVPHFDESGDAESLEGLTAREVSALANWWPEHICIESCSIYSNGYGLTDSASAGANIRLTSATAFCTIRHNELYGEKRTEKHGQEVLDVGWGVSGIVTDGAGPGHVVEYNLIYDMVTHTDTVTDDGDGIGLKETWNRTYYTTGIDEKTLELEDIVSVVVRYNRLFDNEGGGLLVYRNTKNVHVYSNRVYGNGAVTNAAGLAVASGQAQYDPLSGVIHGELSDASCPDGAGDGWGPGTVEDVFIYRNLVYQNVANGIKIEPDNPGECKFVGSIHRVWVVNNTIVYNQRYGLAVRVGDYSLEVDASTYSMSDINVVNNIFAFNGEDTLDVQVDFRDSLFAYSYANGGNRYERGFLYSLQTYNNCYYSPAGSSVILLEGGRASDLSVIEEYLSVWGFVNIETVLPGSSIYFQYTFEDASIEADPEFRTVLANLKLRSSSPCVGAGSSDSGARYYTGPFIGRFFYSPDIAVGPDFEGNEHSLLAIQFGLVEPDIGAYETFEDSALLSLEEA